MITKKTVIVVGAGVSNDLGLPLGPKLKSEVAEVLSGRPSAFSNHFRVAVGNLFKDDQQRAESAIARAKELSVPMTTAASVDNFLDQHKTEQDFVSVAKMAIAYQIALAEQKCEIRGRLSAQQIIQASEKKHFLLDLLNIMVRGHQFETLKPSLDNLTFIIFNYDRCVERILLSWLEMRFGTDAAQLVNPTNFIHVYGSLGDYFANEHVNIFEYEGKFAFQNPHLELPKFVSRIKVFTEQEDSDVSQSIGNAIHQAETVFFLGFGFEEQNMRFFSKQAVPKSVFATLMGQEKPNAEFLTLDLKNRFQTHVVGTVDGKAKQLFKEHYFPITRAVGSLKE